MLRFVLFILFFVFTTQVCPHPFASFSDAHAASMPSRIVISYPTINARLVFLWIAGEEGFFSKYGVDPEAVLVRNSPIQITTLISGFHHLTREAARSISAALLSGVNGGVK